MFSQLQVKKSEATAGNHDNGSEAGGVSSAVVSVMMMENLRMEKLLAACFQVSVYIVQVQVMAFI